MSQHPLKKLNWYFYQEDINVVAPLIHIPSGDRPKKVIYIEGSASCREELIDGMRNSLQYATTLEKSIRKSWGNSWERFPDGEIDLED